MINVFSRIASVKIWAYCTKDDEFYSPNQGVTITISDPEGTVKVNGVAMTESETGKFYYVYNIPSDGELGWWQCNMVGQDGTAPDDKYAVANLSFEAK